MEPIKAATTISLLAPALKSTVYNLPDTSTSFKLAVQRCTAGTPNNWTDTDAHIGMYAFISIDGGQKWNFLGGTTSYGGILMNQGKEVSETSIEIVIPGDSVYAKSTGRLLSFSFATLSGTPPAIDFGVTFS